MRAAYHELTIWGVGTILYTGIAALVTGSDVLGGLTVVAVVLTLAALVLER